MHLDAIVVAALCDPSLACTALDAPLPESQGLSTWGGTISVGIDASGNTYVEFAAGATTPTAGGFNHEPMMNAAARCGQE